MAAQGADLIHVVEHGHRQARGAGRPLRSLAPPSASPVLAKPNVIMNETRLRGLAVTGNDAGGRKSPTTTLRRIGTLDAPSGMRQLVPG